MGKTTLARARRARRSTCSSRACSAPPTCCRPTSSAPTSSTSARTASSSGPGPIFANVVLVDEINRASPKTQSGLLECMQERRVTVDVHTHELARPFVVLATQNPIEFEGTYPLPEAQVDRFMARLSLGYPTSAGEVDMLARPRGSATASTSSSRSPPRPTLLAVQDAARRVHASDALRGYVVALLQRTREDPRVELGASPRAGPDAAARRQGARAAAGPRPRAARRRAGARRGRARPPHRARARGARRRPASRSSPTRWRRRRRCRRRPCARPPPPRSSGSLLIAGRGDLRRRAALRPRRRADPARRRRRRRGCCSAARGVRVARTVGARRAHRGAAGASSTSSSGRPAAAAQRARSRTTCCPTPAAAGHRPAPHARCASTRASRAAGARCCRRRASSSATRSAWPRASCTVRRATTSCSCCRASSRWCAAGGDGDGSGLAARRGRPSVAAEVDLDGLRPLPPGRAGVADLLAGAGARRRADGAPAARRRRHAPARRARPARRRARGGPRRRRARRRLAVRAPRARRRLRAAAARRPAPDRARVRRSSAGRTCTCAWRSSTAHGPPPRGAGRAPRAGPLRRRASPGAPAARAGPRRRRRALPRRARRRRPARGRAAPRSPRGRAPGGLHRGRLHGLRAERASRRVAERAPDGRRRAAAASRGPSRAGAPHPERVRLGAFAALGAVRRAALGRADPARARAATCSCRCSSRSPAPLAADGDARADAPDWQRRTAAGVVAFVLLLLAAARGGGRAAAAARPAPLGRPRRRHVAGHRSLPAIDACPTAASTSGCARRSSPAAARCCSRSRALLAFWPRRGGATAPARRAAVALGVLYAVPIIEHEPDSPVLRRRGLLHPAGRPSCGSSACAPTRSASPLTCVVVAAHRRARSSAPRLDSDAAVVRLRELRRVARAQEGRGVLLDPQLRAAELAARRARAAAHQGADAPATGRRPTSTSSTACAGAQGAARRATRCTSRAINAPQWLQTIQVVDRGLRTTAVRRRRHDAGHRDHGSSRLAPTAAPRHLRDGRASRCARATATRRSVYVPRPTRPSSALAARTTPATRRTSCELRCPLAGGLRGLARPGDRQAAGLDARGALPARTAATAGAGIVWPQRLRRAARTAPACWPSSPYARVYALAQQLGRRRARPTTSCRRVQRRASSATRATTRRPPPAPLPARRLPVRRPAGLLPAVLRRDGAAAADGRGPRARRVGLLRPARSTASASEYVVRDLDAHSWVEAYFPPLRLGHVRPDAGRVAGPLAARRHPARAPTAARRRAPNSARRLGQSGDRPFAAGDPAAPAVAPATAAAAGSCRSAASRSSPALLALGRRRRAVAPAHAVRGRRRPSSPSCSARCTARVATPRPT